MMKQEGGQEGRRGSGGRSEVAPPPSVPAPSPPEPGPSPAARSRRQKKMVGFDPLVDHADAVDGLEVTYDEKQEIENDDDDNSSDDEGRRGSDPPLSPVREPVGEYDSAAALSVSRVRFQSFIGLGSSSSDSEEEDENEGDQEVEFDQEIDDKRYQDYGGKKSTTATSGSSSSIIHRNITFTETNRTQELSSASRISLTGVDATLPMALDNERFFDSEEGYYTLLRQAARKIEQLGAADHNLAWHEGNNEITTIFGVWYRKIWYHLLLRTTQDDVNRLKLTRSLQNHLNMLDGYESFVLGGVIRAYDLPNDDDNNNNGRRGRRNRRPHDAFSFRLALRNRNVSRILRQHVNNNSNSAGGGGRRWDWCYHLSTMVTYSRLFDLFGQFPNTENGPSKKWFAWHVFVQWWLWLLSGSWLFQMLGRKRRRRQPNAPAAVAMNLTPETTGIEARNRDLYGAYLGRQRTTQFRLEHRWPIDESIVRSFMSHPELTLINNGVEHVMRCLAKHWRNMLYQENGNFAHQRMELLDPFEILRFYMPIVLHTLANLRGRHIWDTQVLGPFLAKLEHLNPARFHARRSRRREMDQEQGTDDDEDFEVYGPCHAGIRLVRELQERIVQNVCAGIPSRMEPLNDWLEAIGDSFGKLQVEAEGLRTFVSKVEIGINLGYNMLKLVNWSIPDTKRLEGAIIAYIRGLEEDADEEIPSTAISTALHKLASKDERTLREVSVKEWLHIPAAKLLLKRVVALLERELRRLALDSRLHDLAMGRPIDVDGLELSRWYWVDSGNGHSVAMLKRRSRDGKRLTFVDPDTNNFTTQYDAGQVKCLEYIPIAEAISRAQKAYMNIEIDHCKRFSYNAFMEFGTSLSSSSLRTRLRRLVTLAQVQCSELDKARLNLQTEIMTSVHRSKKSTSVTSRLVPQCRPQNVVVLGGGPTGLLCAIHSLQNVILTGGEVKLYEGRDAFDQEASSFERAQIVRLDARQTAMFRYHLGTGFEDVFIPTKGETDAHLGNTLPAQQFVEVTIKRLESILLDEVIRLRSRDLLQFYSDSKIKYDVPANVFEKLGRSLKLGDIVHHTASGQKFEVKEFVFESSLSPEELEVDGMYDILVPREKVIRTYRLAMKDMHYDWYQFVANEEGEKDLCNAFSELPPIYHDGRGRIDPTGIVVAVDGGGTKTLDFDEVADQPYALDVTGSHVIVALGKPSDSKSHFTVTTSEPYAVCCIEGIKISMGMHNFGSSRYGSGIVDDIQSLSSPNTRIVGDFRKSASSEEIVQMMLSKLSNDKAWKEHFQNLALDLQLEGDMIYGSLVEAVQKLSSFSFGRRYLQNRCFELGNNYYLGMELSREFQSWKAGEISSLTAALHQAESRAVKKLRLALSNGLDKLWYDAALEVLRSSNVYIDGGTNKVPRLYTIDSPFEQQLGELKEQEAFRLAKRTYCLLVHDMDGSSKIRPEDDDDDEVILIPTRSYAIDMSSKTKKVVQEMENSDRFEVADTFEIVHRGRGSSIVRSANGHVVQMNHSVCVVRSNDLSRATDGFSESKVALASFPFAHVVSHRTLLLNIISGQSGNDGFITAFVGDAQASPHFMRYSGLTGACINCMSFNNLVGQSLRGLDFKIIASRYAFETNWSNGEVVQRGTGNNFGRVSFLRPGFSHGDLIDYLYDRALEYIQIGPDDEPFLSRDWKAKIAAAIVPRGLETDNVFYESLVSELDWILCSKFSALVGRKVALADLPYSMGIAMLGGKPSVLPDSPSPVPAGDEQLRIEREALEVLKVVIDGLLSVLHSAIEQRLSGDRIFSEVLNQPKSADSVVDSCAVEAQLFANAFAQSIAFSAATVALFYFDETAAKIVSAILCLLNMSVSFRNMVAITRYRNRNEEVRRKILDEKITNAMKASFSLMPKAEQDRLAWSDNPYGSELDDLFQVFLTDAKYYDMANKDIAHFQTSYQRFQASNSNKDSMIDFMSDLIQGMILRVQNSYLQEDLVSIYQAVGEMFVASRIPSGDPTIAGDLFQAMLELRKDRTELADVDGSYFLLPVSTSLRALLCRNVTSPSNIRRILKKFESLQMPGTNAMALRRPLLDITELYFATSESQAGCIMYLSALIVFCFSFLFFIFLVVELAAGDSDWVSLLLDVLAWVALGSLIESYLALSHFVRTFRQLSKLETALRSNKNDPQISRIRRVAASTKLLAAMRLLAVIGASVSLPWSIAVSNWGSGMSVSGDYAVYVACASAAVVIFAALGSCIEEYSAYHLDSCFGLAVVELFQSRLDALKRAFTMKDRGVGHSRQMKEAESWEYAARQLLHEFRFDMVLGPDRFGTVLQQLQSRDKRHLETR